MKKITPQRSHVSKRRKVEEKTAEKKSQKRKHVVSSDSEINTGKNVQNIVSTIRRKIRGKRIF